MKVYELTEQLQKRKSPEELAAVKAAPDYWKTVARKEFNAIIKKFGATSREKYNRTQSDNSLRFDRDIAVLVSGANSLTLHRDTRAHALLLAIAKWLVAQKKQGRQVTIAYWGVQDNVANGQFGEDDLNKAHHLLVDLSRIEQTIDWLRQIGERGEKLPLKMDLRFTIELPKNG